MKIALIQMHVDFNKNNNIAAACNKIKEAGLLNIDMVVLPEMFCCPYSGKYFREYGEEEGGPVQETLSGLAKEMGIFIVGGSIPELCDNKIYNTSYVYDNNGKQIAKHRKAHLFDIDIKGKIRFFESEYLTAGDEITVFNSPFGIMGLCICFDFRFPEVASAMAKKGAVLIIVPAAFNMTTGPAHWETMFRQRAVDNQVFTIGAAPARDEDGVYVSYGNSIAVNPWGEVIARCGGNECTLIVDVDFKLVEDVRSQLPLISSRREELY